MVRRHSRRSAGEHRRHRGRRGAPRRDRGDQPPASRPRHRRLAAAGRRRHDRDSAHRRLPVRRGALPRRSARPRLDLPLPHVPEGVRRVLSARWSPAHGVTWTRGAPKHFASSEPRPRAASAAIAARRSPSSIDGGIELGDRRLRRPAAAAAGRSRSTRRTSCPSSTAFAGLPMRGARRRSLGRTSCKHRAINHQHPDHDTEAWPPASLSRVHDARNASISSTPRCATARRPPASTSRSRTRSLVAQHARRLGVDYVEGGYPGANPTDTAFFEEKRTERADVHRLRHDQAGRASALANDPGLQALLDAKADAICFVAKTWDYQVRVALGITRGGEPRRHPPVGRRRRARRARKCSSTASTSSTATRPTRPTRSPAPRRPTTPARAGSCSATPMAARCRRRSRRSSREVAKAIPGDHLGIHAHNDTGAGGRQFAGRGPRRRAPDPGHAQRHRRALRQRQPHLAHPDAAAEAGLCRPLRDRRHARTASPSSPSSPSASTSCSTARRTGRRPMSAPSAFATKAGIHASAIAKDPRTYEHVDAGERRQPPPRPGLRAGGQGQPARRAASASASRSTKDDPRLDTLLREVKEREVARLCL